MSCSPTCSKGCVICNSTNSSLCLKCSYGNALMHNGQCMKCLKNCTGSCDSTNINICTSCADGF
jgi:hypothetical protein